MINRRTIRVKILQILFSYTAGAMSTLEEAEKNLKYTFDKIYDLYHFILLFLEEFVNYANFRTEKEKNKYLPTTDDKLLNKKFTKNKIIVQLNENRQLQEYISNKKYTWFKNPDIIKKIYETFIHTDQYINYISSEDNSYTADKDILLFLIQEILYNSTTLYTFLEEESIYWIDNVDLVLTSVASIIEHFSVGDDMKKRLAKKFKNKDDQKFAYHLLNLTILNREKYTQIIINNIINRDFDRISQIDKLILKMAVAELIDFAEIPIKVTLNEYIEISKKYSIPGKSANFINGILDKIVANLKKQQIINKKGRGLKEK